MSDKSYNIEMACVPIIPKYQLGVENAHENIIMNFSDRDIGAVGIKPAVRKSRHVLVVKMFSAIFLCFIFSFTGMVLPLVLGLDDHMYYLVFTNNLCNPVIYYWLNKEFRAEYNDFWKHVWKTFK